MGTVLTSEQMRIPVSSQVSGRQSSRMELMTINFLNVGSLYAVACTVFKDISSKQKQSTFFFKKCNQQIMLAGHECFHGGEFYSEVIAIEYTYFEHYCHDALLHPVPETFGHARHDLNHL